MKLKLTLLFTALCSIAMAQDFHGVSIGGTLSRPTLINPPDNQPIIGFAALRHTDNGIDVPLLTLDQAWIAHNNPIGPGSERSMLGLTSGFRMEMLGRDGVWYREGEPTGYDLLGVMFADGTFVGTDIAYNYMASHYAKVRSIARDLQVTEDKYTVMSRKITAGSLVSADSEMLSSKFAMSGILLRLRDERGEDEADKALARLAGLPDMVRGGPQ